MENAMTKEQYLTWRAEWRQNYKALTQEIRDQRTQIKAPIKTEAELWQRAMVQSRKAMNRVKAHQMMIELEEMKQTAKASRDFALIKAA